MKQRVLVLGGLGFIGRKLLSLLIKQGFEVTVIEKDVDRFDRKTCIGFELIEMGHNSRNAILNAEIVIDLSYSTNPMTSFKSPIRDISDNLPRAVALFELLQKNQVLKKIIVISSGGTVYGNQLAIPIEETAETNPISPYGITKLAIEKYAMMFHLVGGLPAIILRPSNAYGPGQMPFSGQGFVSTAIGHILKGERITLFGNGSTVRDYVFVEDLVDCIVKTIENGKIGSFYNVGSGKGYSNLEVINNIKEIIQKDVEINYNPSRSFDVIKNVLSIDKIYNDTGWSPKTSLNKGLAYSIKWIKRQLDMYGK